MGEVGGRKGIKNYTHSSVLGPDNGNLADWETGYGKGGHQLSPLIPVLMYGKAQEWGAA